MTKATRLQLFRSSQIEIRGLTSVSPKESMQQQCYSSPLHSTSQRLSAALFLGAERCYGGGKSSVAAAYSP